MRFFSRLLPSLTSSGKLNKHAARSMTRRTLAVEFTSSREKKNHPPRGVYRKKKKYPTLSSLFLPFFPLHDKIWKAACPRTVFAPEARPPRHRKLFIKFQHVPFVPGHVYLFDLGVFISVLRGRISYVVVFFSLVGFRQEADMVVITSISPSTILTVGRFLTIDEAPLYEWGQTHCTRINFNITWCFSCMPWMCCGRWY